MQYQILALVEKMIDQQLLQNGNGNGLKLALLEAKAAIKKLKHFF